MSGEIKRPLKDIQNTINEFMLILEGLTTKSEIAGSIRRKKELIGDVDIVVIAKPGLDDALTSILTGTSGINGTWQIIGTFKDIKVNVLKSTEKTWGAAMLHTTGSLEFNVVLRAHAKNRGMRLNQHGLFEGETCVSSETEEGILDYLGFEYVPPEARGDTQLRSKFAEGMEKVFNSKGEFYLVGKSNGKWKCSCKGFMFRKHCRHIDIAIDRISKQDSPKEAYK